MMKAQFVAMRLAFAFLTRIPGAHPQSAVSADFARAHAAFPLVGMLIGALIGLVDRGLAYVGLPAFCCAVMALAAGALLTGALHEDGLADMADGFGGGRDMETKLAIMRDSRLGTYGALALVMVSLCKVGAIAQPSGFAVVGWLALAHGVSRTAATVVLRILPPARRDGLAASTDKPGKLIVGISVCISAAATVVLVPGGRMLAVALTAAGLVCFIAVLARRQIGGVTGDVLGATQQLTETGILVVLAATSTINA